MSVRIYRAYRLRKGFNLWAVVSEIRVRGREEARQCLVDLAASQMAVVSSDSDVYRSALGDSHILPNETSEDWEDYRARKSIVEKHMRDGYRESLVSAMRNEYDFDVSVDMIYFEGRAYFRLFCDMSMKRALDFLGEMSSLEDFSYWNNTDKPEGTSQRQWRTRKRVWGAIGKVWDSVPQMVIVISDYMSWYRVTPFCSEALGPAYRMAVERVREDSQEPGEDGCA